MMHKCAVLCEGRQTQKATDHMSLFTGHSGKGKTIGKDDRLLVSRDQGEILTGLRELSVTQLGCGAVYIIVCIH